MFYLTKDLLPTLPPWAGVLSLHGQDLVAGWATSVASVRQGQKPPPCLAEPVSGNSETDVPLAKPGPVGNACNSSDNILKKIEKIKSSFSC